MLASLCCVMVQMSPPRFFLDVFPAQGCVSLSKEDARHAQSVLRLKVGDSLQLFDGRGNQAEASIVRMSKSSVEVDVVASDSVSRELPRKLELIVALPKGDRQKVLIDMLVQLGVDQLTPLHCERSVAQPTDNAVERLQRSVIETCKQCGRNQLMQVNAPTSIGQLGEQKQDKSNVSSPIRTLNLFAHPYGTYRPLLELLRSACGDQASEPKREDLPSPSIQPPKARVIIGPEGGLSDAECEQLLTAGWTQASLGSSILRIETAAIMVAATWAALNSDT